MAPVFVALSLAYFIFPLVKLVENKLLYDMPRKRIISVALVMLLSVGIIIILAISIMPPLINQTMAFGREISTYSLRFFRLVDQLQVYLDGIGLDKRITGSLDDLLAQLFTAARNYAGGFATSALGVLSRSADIIIVIILVFYFLIDGQRMIAYIVDHSPDMLRDALMSVIDGVGRVVWGYMKNQVIISVIYGAATGIAFMILGIHFSGLLGLISGVLNMVPYFGSILSVLIAVLMAALYLSMERALLTAIVALIINVVLGNIITPRIQAKTLGIHPVVVITSLLVCNHLWGAIGMFIAVPLVGLGQLIMVELLKVIKKL